MQYGGGHFHRKHHNCEHYSPLELISMHNSRAHFATVQLNMVYPFLRSKQFQDLKQKKESTTLELTYIWYCPFCFLKSCILILCIITHQELCLLCVVWDIGLSQSWHGTCGGHIESSHTHLKTMMPHIFCQMRIYFADLCWHFVVIRGFTYLLRAIFFFPHCYLFPSY